MPEPPIPVLDHFVQQVRTGKTVPDLVRELGPGPVRGHPPEPSAADLNQTHRLDRLLPVDPDRMSGERDALRHPLQRGLRAGIKVQLHPDNRAENGTPVDLGPHDVPRHRDVGNGPLRSENRHRLRMLAEVPLNRLRELPRRRARINRETGQSPK